MPKIFFDPIRTRRAHARARTRASVRPAPKFTTTPRHGVLLWEAAKRVQTFCEQTGTAWFAGSLYGIVDQLAPSFDMAAKMINTQAKKALLDGAPPEQVLLLGKPGLAARDAVRAAEAEAWTIWQLIKEAAAAGSHPVSFALVADPGKWSYAC